MDEAGEPNGDKYAKVKEVIEKHFNLQPQPIPAKAQKLSIPSFKLQKLGSLFTSEIQNLFVQGDPESSERPKTFEELRLFSGFVLYIADLPSQEIDPTLLRVRNVRDRALVYIDDHYIGTLSRENAIDSLPLSAKLGSKLKILVENQGRINYNIADDKKVDVLHRTIRSMDLK